MGREIVGMRFNHWEILKWLKPEERINKNKAYIAKCDCGTVTEIRISDLKNNKSTKCRHCVKKGDKLINYRLKIKIGEKYNSLTILEGLYDKKDGRYKFLCRCNCGKEVLKRPNDIYTGNTKSCGCLFEKNFDKRQDRIGEKYGKLTILEVSERKDKQGKQCYRICQCECGELTEVYIGHLITGHTQSCGCIVSFGEEWVKNFLEEKQISFLRQYTHPELIYKDLLRIDFALFKNDDLYGFIEVMGRHHYDKNSRFYSEENVKRDFIKREFCKNKNIPILYLDYSKELLLNNSLQWEKQIMEFVNETKI